MRLELDDARCVGHGRCYALAPDLFGEDDRGHCVLLLPKVPPHLEDDARRGEANCPEAAIRLVQD